MNIILFDRMPRDNMIEASDFRAEHIRKVLHLEVGDTLRLGVLNGQSGTATILAMDEAGIHYSWQPEEHPDALHPVTLLVAQVRPICMKRILREAVSFGVEELIVVGTDTGERSYAEAKLWSTGEYRKYLLDGAMQSGCTGFPPLRLVKSVDEFIGETERWPTRLLLDNQMQSSPLSRLGKVDAPVLVAVGPERGWSDRERLLFASHAFVSKTMGNRILRTETACSAALAILLGRMELI